MATTTVQRMAAMDTIPTVLDTRELPPSRTSTMARLVVMLRLRINKHMIVRPRRREVGVLESMRAIRPILAVRTHLKATDTTLMAAILSKARLSNMVRTERRRKAMDTQTRDNRHCHGWRVLGPGYRSSSDRATRVPRPTFPLPSPLPPPPLLRRRLKRSRARAGSENVSAKTREVMLPL